MNMLPQHIISVEFNKLIVFILFYQVYTYYGLYTYYGWSKQISDGTADVAAMYSASSLIRTPWYSSHTEVSGYVKLSGYVNNYIHD